MRERRDSAGNGAFRQGKRNGNARKKRGNREDFASFSRLPGGRRRFFFAFPALGGGIQCGIVVKRLIFPCSKSETRGLTAPAKSALRGFAGKICLFLLLLASLAASAPDARAWTEKQDRQRRARQAQDRAAKKRAAAQFARRHAVFEKGQATWMLNALTKEKIHDFFSVENDDFSETPVVYYIPKKAAEYAAENDNSLLPYLVVFGDGRSEVRAECRYSGKFRLTFKSAAFNVAGKVFRLGIEDKDVGRSRLEVLWTTTTHGTTRTTVQANARADAWVSGAWRGRDFRGNGVAVFSAGGSAYSVSDSESQTRDESEWKQRFDVALPEDFMPAFDEIVKNYTLPPMKMDRDGNAVVPACFEQNGRSVKMRIDGDRVYPTRQLSCEEVFGFLAISRLEKILRGETSAR